MTNWLTKAQDGCAFCAEVNDLGKRELCPDRDEHQRTAMMLENLWDEALDAVLDGRTINADSEIDRRVRAVRQRGPA